MAERAPLMVEYSGLDDTPVIVERVASEVVDDAFTRGVIRAVRDAYLPQYGGVQLPASVIQAAYNPEDDVIVAERAEVIRDRIRTDTASYWVVRGDQPDRLKGVAKVMYSTEETYIADLVVPPPWRQGFGRRLLHASLQFGGADRNATVALDGFEGSGVNEWYKRLGFVPQLLSGHLDVGPYGHAMLMRRYAVPRRIGLDGLIAALECQALQVKPGTPLPMPQNTVS